MPGNSLEHLLKQNREWSEAMRAEDRAALNEVFDVVNREAAGPRLVGGVCDVYAGLVPVLSTPEGQEFLSTWTARLTGLEDQFN